MKNNGSDIANSIVAEWNKAKKMQEYIERKKEKQNKNIMKEGNND